MISPSGEYAESRPFKIFISLLDKWEIGAILTETLVYDAFNAIMNLVKNSADSGEDVCAGSIPHLGVADHLIKVIDDCQHFV